MKICPICKIGFIKNNSKTLFSCEKDKVLFLIKNVKAKTCNNCGEIFHNLKTTQQIFSIMNADKTNTELRIIKL